MFTATSPRIQRALSRHRKRRLVLNVERLEARLTPDSGGAAGQLASINLPYGGGPLIQNVVVNQIFLQDTKTQNETPAATQTQLDAFLRDCTSNSYIPTLASPYSVPPVKIGTGTLAGDDINVPITPDFTIQGFPAIGDTLIENTIQQEINAGRTAAPSGNNLYIVYTPPGDGSRDGANNNSIIGSYFGYHSYFSDSDGVHNDYYAVIPDPGSPNNLTSGDLYSSVVVSAIQELTDTTSHELIEAITDPGTPDGWYQTTGLQDEICDLVANDSYVQDGYLVQYQWSNALKGAAHAIGTGPNNLFINQLAAPAVSSFAGGPVATFTDLDPTRTPGSFTATVNFNDGKGVQPATVTGGANGVYVVSATPKAPLAVKTYGTPVGYNGLRVEVFDTSHGAVGSGVPVTDRAVPYTIQPVAPLIYNADQGGIAHNFVLRENAATGNFELTDNGELVFTQAISQTTNITIGADPGVDSSLTVDYSGGVFTNPISFDGGTGAGAHTLTVSGGAFTSITDTPTGANAGSVSLASAAGSQTITFTDAAGPLSLTPASVASLTLNLPAGAAGAALMDDATPGNGVSLLQSTSGAFPQTPFTDPSSSLAVNFGSGATVTVSGLDSRFSAGLTLSDQGAGSDTVTFNGALNLGAAASGNGLSVTAGTVSVDQPISTTNAGTVTFTNSGVLTVAAAVTAAGTFTESGSGTLALGANINAGSADISLNTPTTLTASATLTGANVTIGSTLDDATAGLHSLTIAGNATVEAAVGASQALAALSVTQTVSLPTSSAVMTTGAQSYAGANLTSTMPISLTASTVTFAGNLNLNTTQLNIAGNFALTNTAAFDTTLAGSGQGQFGSVSYTGSANLGGAGLSVSVAAGFTPPLGTTFDLVAANGGTAVTGAFAGIAEGGLFVAGSTYFGSTYLGGPTHGDAVIHVRSPATSIGLAASPAPAIFTQAITFTATVAPVDGGPPTGTVIFSVDGTATPSVPLNSNGQAPLTLSTLLPGTHQINATYSGDGNFNGSTTPQSLAAVVNAVGVVNGDLFVAGTAGNDTLSIHSLGAGQVDVAVNGADQGTFSLGAGHTIQVHGLGGSDTVSFNSANLPAVVTADTGNVTLDLSATTGANQWALIGAGTGAVGAISFSTASNLIGTGADTLLGPATANSWLLTSANAGTFNNILAFSGMANLTGGAGNDTFTFAATGSIGRIDGGGGTNTLDYSSYNARTVVDLTHGVATAVSNYAYHVIANIQHAVGSTSATNLLVGTPAATLWNIMGANIGTATPTGGSAFLFSNFPCLAGGAGNDTFTFTGAGASEAGYIDGGAGANTFDYSAYPGTVVVNVGASAASAVKSLNGGVFEIQNFIGNTSSTNHLVGPNTTDTWNLAGANAGTFMGTGSFSGFPNLTGGTGADTFSFAAGVTLSGTLDGGLGAGLNTLDYTNYSARAVVDLTHGVATAVSNYAYHAIADFQAALGSNNATNLLVGSPANTLWNITGANSGSATPSGGAAFTFSSFPTLAGGAGNDTFTFTGAGASEAGYIDGGAGANTFDYSAYPGTLVVNVAAKAATAVKGLAGSGVFEIQNFIGNTTSTNHLVGPNTADTWDLTGANAGTFMGTGSFSGFPNLTGGTGADTFSFAPGATLSGTLDGGLGAGLNTLDYSNYNARAVVDLTHGVATAVSNYAYRAIANFQAAVGSSAATSLLVGSPANTFWNITGANSGSATPSGGAAFTFSSFPTLAGGTGNDTFKFTGASASETGYIDGGAGANTFDYSAYPGTIVVNVAANAATAVKSLNGGGAFEIQNFIGNTVSANHLVGPNTTDTWNLTGTNAGTFMGTGSFSGFPNLTGGSGDDTYHFAVGALLSGNLGDSGGHNWLDYSAWTTAVTVNLTTGSATGSAGNVSGIQDVIGGAGVDTITGGATGGVLIGGGGNDTITAGAGRSILIGAAGNDQLNAGANGDILIGGSTTFDTPNVSQAALVAVLAEWQRTDINYAARVTDIKNGTGLTQGNKLAFGNTVLDDGASNTLSGNGSASGNELDWYFANQAAGHDTIVKLLAGEQVN